MMWIQEYKRKREKNNKGRKNIKHAGVVPHVTRTRWRDSKVVRHKATCRVITDSHRLPFLFLRAGNSIYLPEAPLHKSCRIACTCYLSS